MFYWDPMYFVFALPALLLAFWAQMKVRSAYSKYLKVPNSSGISGGEAAERLLSSQGLSGVGIEGTAGTLTDHYDPRDKTLHLSQGVAYSKSVAAVSIVAHEVGHALQDSTQYAPMRLRTGIVGLVTVSSWIGPLIFIGGMLFNSSSLSWVGLILFSSSVLFALVTLPVEMNASQRALQMLTSTGLLVTREEQEGARSVLNAAAWTYVAALVQVLSTLLYYVSILSGSSRRRR